MGYSPVGCKESNMTEFTYTHTHTPLWALEECICQMVISEISGFLLVT